VRAIVVTGAGKGYCAGADMDMLQGLGRGSGLDAIPDELHVELDPSLPEEFRGEYSYPLGLTKPVIAAVNGVAAGLGISYMLYYDLRFASDRARFGFLFPRRGSSRSTEAPGSSRVSSAWRTPPICSSRAGS